MKTLAYAAYLPLGIAFAVLASMQITEGNYITAGVNAFTALTWTFVAGFVIGSKI